MTSEPHWIVIMLMSLQILAATGGFVAVCINLVQSKKIEKSKFIHTLTVAALEFSPALTKLDSSSEPLNQPDDKEHARSFLRLSESIMLLVEEKVITAEEIFPLLGYRILTFMNHPWVRETMLKQNEGRHAPRSCGAYALYQCLFTHLTDRFSSNIPMALLDFKHIDYRNSLYWEADFTGAVAVYYEHKRKGKKKVMDSNHIHSVRKKVAVAMANFDAHDARKRRAGDAS